MKQSAIPHLRVFVVFCCLQLLVAIYSTITADTTQTTKKVSVEKLDKKQWQKLSDGVDYRDDVKEEQQKRKLKEQNESPNERLQLPAIFLNNWVRYGMLFIVTLLLLFFIIRLIIQHYNPAITSYNEQSLLETIEENLLESDIDKFIKQALSQSNYRLALRLYYLKCIKELSIHNRVVWKKDKTNYEYLSELKNWEEQKTFQNITQNYERIWYGELTLEQADFKIAETTVLQFLSRI
jgi:glutaredoxin